jgi:virginiamycin B lyase
MSSSRKRITIICLAALSFSQVASLSAQQAAIIEHRLPRRFEPKSVTSGPDGALWVTGYSSPSVNDIARITTAGAITWYSMPQGSSPVEITAGPDGALWFTDSIEGGGIGRITTAGVVTEYPIPTANSSPQGITSGPDGALWFTEHFGGKIGRITTAGVISEYTLPSGSLPGEITAGPDGALWFTDYDSQANLDKIRSITTAGVITDHYSKPIYNGSGFGFRGITAGPDGALWFAEMNEFKIGRITTAGVVTEYQVPGAPFYVTVGPDSALWFTQAYADDAIGRITTAGVVTGYPLPTADTRTSSITAGSDGSLWFAEYYIVQSSGQQIGQLVFTTATTAITPSTGSPGTNVTLNGSGFSSGENVNLYGNSTGSNPLGTVAAASDGSFVTSGRWPQAAYGHLSVAGVGQTSGKLGVGSFFVLPRIVVTPSSVPAGGTITVQGFGFGNTDYVGITLHGYNLGSAVANQQGSFSGSTAVEATIPATTPPGIHAVVGQGQSTLSVSATAYITVE